MTILDKELHELVNKEKDRELREYFCKCIDKDRTLCESFSNTVDKMLYLCSKEQEYYKQKMEGYRKDSKGESEEKYLTWEKRYYELENERRQLFNKSPWVYLIVFKGTVIKHLRSKGWIK